MRSKVKNPEECTSLFEIEVGREKIAKAFDEVYDEIVKIASIPGFRTGKAPKELVKKHYARNAKDEVLKRLLAEAYRKALEDHKVSPIGLPDITDVNFDEGIALTFKASVDTRPKFKLKNYKALKLEKKKAVLADEEVDKTLNNLREMSAHYLPVEDRPAQMGDYIVCDMECFVDGKPAHKKRENIWFYLDNESALPGLSQGIVGMNKAQEKEMDLTIPEKYPDKNLASKKAKYRVKVREIKTRKLPDLNDEFARGLGKENMDSLKKEVVSELTARLKSGIEVDLENQLLKRLTDDNTFSVPSNFVRRQLEHMVENAKRNLEEKGFKKEDIDKNDKELRDRFKQDAERQVRLLFILDEIADSEGIKVDPEDMNIAYKEIAARAGRTEPQVREHYEKEDLSDSLEEKIREGKTIKFLLDNSEIKESD